MRVPVIGCVSVGAGDLWADAAVDKANATAASAGGFQELAAVAVALGHLAGSALCLRGQTTYAPGQWKRLLAQCLSKVATGRHGMLDGFSKTVLITGAAQGFGRVCALAFAERGARLALCDMVDAGWPPHRTSIQ